VTLGVRPYLKSWNFELMVFEWDTNKAEINIKKHGVTFHEAATVLGDPLAITFPDPDHSVDEYCHIKFCFSRFSRLLVVAHTDREGRIRIISARPMTKKERDIYEEG